MKPDGKTIYILRPAGLLDICDQRVTRNTGEEVRKVQPFGCPRNGTFGMCYVERVADGQFIGLVNVASLERKPK